MGQHAENFSVMPYLTDTEAFRVPVDLHGRTFCGDLDIRIDSHGQWHYNGNPLVNREMVCLFAAMLVAGDDGRYWLVSPNEIGRIEVDDAPFIAIRKFTAGRGKNRTVSVLTNTDQVITIKADTPLIVKPSPVNGAITLYVMDEHGLEARLSRGAAGELLDLGVSRKENECDAFGLWSCGTFFPLNISV